MAKNLLITGNGMVDEQSRYEALEALQIEGSTEELVKLQKAIKNPMYRNLLKSI